MKSNFDASLKALLVHEGGNDDDPRDPGGRTSRGITQTEYDLYRTKKRLSKRDVWTADQAEVVDIYRTKYWAVLQCDDLPSGVDYAVFDYGVNSGVSRSAKVLQRVLGVPEDGEIGNQTVSAAHEADADEVINDICDERMAFLQGLKTWATFGRGWTNRVTEVRTLALEMAAEATLVEPETPRESPWVAFFRWLLGLFSRKSPSEPVAKSGAPWVAEVRKCTGIRETVDGEEILSWRDQFPTDMKKYAYQYTSPTGQPWCGFGLGAAMARAGIRPPFGPKDTLKFMWADSWAHDWGQKLDGPIPGCIGVRTRNGGGHVTMVEKVFGKTIYCRGFNQSDSVNVSKYTLDNQWTGFYWPPGYAVIDVVPDISNSVAAGSES